MVNVVRTERQRFAARVALDQLVSSLQNTEYLTTFTMLDLDLLSEYFVERSRWRRDLMGGEHQGLRVEGEITRT
jgi:hypothetical protein